jgi:hypothetical protein
MNRQLTYLVIIFACFGHSFLLAQDFGNPELGSGLTIYNNTEVKVYTFKLPQKTFSSYKMKSQSFKLVDCQNDFSGNGPNMGLKQFALNGEMIASVKACDELKSIQIKRFSDEYCSLTKSCTKSKLSNDRPDTSVYSLKQKIAAENFVALKLNSELEKMESIEKVRQFADKKYGQSINSTCQSPFDFDSTKSNMKNNCNTDLLTNGFNQLQKFSCSNFQRNCFINNSRDEKINFNVFLDKQNSTDGLSFQSFLQARSSSSHIAPLANETEMLTNLSSIISLKSSSSVKLKAIYAKLLEYQKSGKLDPIMEFDNSINNNESEFFKSNHYKFFEALINLKPSNSTKIKDAIEEYRRTTAANILGKTCSQSTRISQICYEATDVQLRFIKPTANKPLVDRLKIRQSLPTDTEDENYLKLKEMYPNSIHNLEDYSNVMDDQRCRSFTLEDIIISTNSTGVSNSVIVVENALSNSSSNDNENDREAGDLRPPVYFPQKSDYSQNQFRKIENESKPSFSQKMESPLGDSGNSSQASIAQSKDDQVIIKNDTQKNADVNLAKTKSASGSNDGLTNNFSNEFDNNVSNITGNLGNNLTHSSGANPSEGNQENSNQKINETFSGSSFTNEKMKDLKSQLEKSEANLAKVKAEQSSTMAEIEREKKISEENKTIEDLNKQIAQLKTNSPVNVQKIDNGSSAYSDTFSNNKFSNPTNNLDSTTSSTNNEIVKDKSFNPQTMARIENSQSNEINQSTGTNSSNGSIPSGSSSVNSGSTFSGSAQSAGLVLISVDGMTSEKANQAIIDKILDSNGAPFSVKEGEAITIIVPELDSNNKLKMVDGKPVFKTIDPEKNGKKLAVKNAASVKKTRAPASITSPADLLRDQEEQLKRDRVEYRNLKNLVNKAFLNK